MSPVALVLGALFGAGLLAVAVGWTGGVSFPSRRRALADRLDGAVLRRAATAVMAAAVCFGATGWLVGSVFAGLGVVFLPGLLSNRTPAGALSRRSEAVATWAEMLRDTMAGAAGIEAAVAHTAGVAPTEIREATTRLAAALDHEPLVPALHRFADDVADPAADLVVSALSLAVERQARDLGALLGAVAAAARSEATMVLRVEAGRARLRTAVRVVSGFTIGFALLMVVFNRAYLEPFDDALGQLVLLVVGLSFAAGFWQLDRMAHIPTAGRLLARPDAPQPGTAS